MNEVVASNMKARRLVADLSQQALAGRMAALGHSWTLSTVGDVETRGRRVTVDELAALALSLGALLAELLDPAGILGLDTSPIDPGAGETTDGAQLVAGEVLSGRLGRAWVWSLTRFSVTATDPLSWRIAPAGPPASLGEAIGPLSGEKGGDLDGAR